MAETLKFELVSPEKLLVSKDVISVKVPGDEGDYVVLPEHMPFLSTLRPGIVEVSSEDGTDRIFVKGGFADAGPTNLTILAEVATNCSELTGETLEAERKLANEAVEKAETDAAKRHANELVSCLAEL